MPKFPLKISILQIIDKFDSLAFKVVLALCQTMFMVTTILFVLFSIYSKMIMEKLSLTTFVVFLDDGKMNSTLAEFLLQLQGGLSQGSTSQGLFVPKGSVILTSNYHEPKRYLILIIPLYVVFTLSAL